MDSFPKLRTAWSNLGYPRRERSGNPTPTPPHGWYNKWQIETCRQLLLSGTSCLAELGKFELGHLRSNGLELLRNRGGISGAGECALVVNRTQARSRVNVFLPLFHDNDHDLEVGNTDLSCLVKQWKL